MNYQFMRPLLKSEYDELKADIAQRGVMVPIEFDEHGNVLDGHHRLQICRELGITNYPKVIRVGMSEAQKVEHSEKLNSARRQMTAEDRSILREKILCFLKEHPDVSDRRIAKEFGVSNPTISKYRKEMEETGELLKVNTSTGSDGKQYPRQVEHRSFDLPPATTMWEAESQERARVALDIPSEPIEPEHRPHVANNSGNNEWYTPADYMEIVRDVMGGIDCDPASSDIANETVQAAEYFTAETDGLKQKWHGRVWLNPPYSSDLIGRFIDKLIEELPNIDEAIVLVNNATETEWFNKMIPSVNAVCFPRSRVKFYMPDGKTGAPLQGQALLYFGENADRFIDKFSVKGWCAVPK